MECSIWVKPNCVPCRFTSNLNARSLCPTIGAAMNLGEPSDASSDSSDELGAGVVAPGWSAIAEAATRPRRAERRGLAARKAEDEEDEVQTEQVYAALRPQSNNIATTDGLVLAMTCGGTRNSSLNQGAPKKSLSDTQGYSHIHLAI